jgi:hypothetical protein
VTVGAQLLTVYVVVLHTVDVVYLSDDDIEVTILLGVGVAYGIDEDEETTLVVVGVTYGIGEIEEVASVLVGVAYGISGLEDVAVNENVMQEHAELKAEEESQLLKSVGTAVAAAYGARYDKQANPTTEVKRGSTRFL